MNNADYHHLESFSKIAHYLHRMGWTNEKMEELVISLIVFLFI